MAQLAVKGLPYFKITEVTSEHSGLQGSKIGLIHAEGGTGQCHV